jgi:hypothetical protein
MKQQFEILKADEVIHVEDQQAPLRQVALVVQKTPETLVNRGFSKRQQFLSFSRK